MARLHFEETNAFKSGHVACPGCVEALAMRVVLNKIGSNAVAVVPPSCTAVICGPHPTSALGIPVYHTSIESSAASASGIRRALDARGQRDTRVVVLAGDGGTFDIGFQALSSAAERNEDILYVCFDNEGYMNTGAQKSASTPLHAVTGSTPGGKLSKKKNIVEMLAAQEIPYAATATPGDLADLGRKVERALARTGLRFLLVHIPCLDGWGIAEDQGVTAARRAVDCGIFPLYEVEDGRRYTLNRDQPLAPVDDYLGMQKRYRTLSAEARAQIQAAVEEDWARLLHRAGHPAPAAR